MKTIAVGLFIPLMQGIIFGENVDVNQHSFLLPFSPEMFNFESYPTGPDFSKLSNLTLTIYGNKLWEDTKWTVEITAVSFNVSRIVGGSIGLPVL